MTKKQLKKKQDLLTTLKKEAEEAKGQMAEATALGGAFEFKIPEVYTLTEQVSLLNSRIAKLGEELRSVDVIEEQATETDVVSLFSCVKVCDLSTKKEEWYCFEESDEKNAQVISQESPIGKALLGKKVGEVVEVQTPSGLRKVEILDIR